MPSPTEATSAGVAFVMQSDDKENKEMMIDARNWMDELAGIVASLAFDTAEMCSREEWEAVVDRSNVTAVISVSA